MQGYTHKMIAQALGISHRTVNIHVEHIKDKIGAHSKAHMLQYISLNLH
jgi:DNA-binding CsgD family transcriptional regulator